MRKETMRSAIPRALLLSLLAAVAVLWFFTALSNLEQGRDMESKQQLEDALRRSTVAYYAEEGVYPPNISCLEEHYGIQMDKKHFTVKYEIFAENLMPSITVLENEL